MVFMAGAHRCSTTRRSRLTAKGRRLEKTINAQAHVAELRIAEMLGPRPFAELRHALEELSRRVTQHDA
jgi:hypothetical protein